MWKNLKKAWNIVKAGTLAVGAWIGEIASTGDLMSANSKFNRTYTQKRMEYSAGDMLGSTLARAVRGAAGLGNTIADAVHSITADEPAVTITPRPNDSRRAQQAQAQLEANQAVRRAAMEEKHDAIRDKYNIPKKPQATEKRGNESWEQGEQGRPADSSPRERK